MTYEKRQPVAIAC